MLLRCVGTPSAVDEAKEQFRKLMTLVHQRSLTYTDPLHMRWMSTEKLREPQFRHVEEKAKCTIHLLESSLKHHNASPSPTERPTRTEPPNGPFDAPRGNANFAPLPASARDALLASTHYGVHCLVCPISQYTAIITYP